MALTRTQQQHIYDLSEQGLSGRKIAEQLGISYKAVRIVLEKKPTPAIAEKVDQLYTAAANNEFVTQQPLQPQSKEKCSSRNVDDDKPREPKQKLRSMLAADLLAPSHTVFEVKTGLEWLHQQLGQMLEEAPTFRDQIFILDHIRQIYSEAAASLESIHNIELLDAFIEEVTRILEEQIPEVRDRIYRRLERCGLDKGVITLVSNSSQR